MEKHLQQELSELQNITFRLEDLIPKEKLDAAVIKQTQLEDLLKDAGAQPTTEIEAAAQSTLDEVRTYLNEAESAFEVRTVEVDGQTRLLLHCNGEGFSYTAISEDVSLLSHQHGKRKLNIPVSYAYLSGNAGSLKLHELLENDDEQSIFFTRLRTSSAAGTGAYIENESISRVFDFTNYRAPQKLKDLAGLFHEFAHYWVKQKLAAQDRKLVIANRDARDAFKNLQSTVSPAVGRELVAKEERQAWAAALSLLKRLGVMIDLEAGKQEGLRDMTSGAEISLSTYETTENEMDNERLRAGFTTRQRAIVRTLERELAERGYKAADLPRLIEDCDARQNPEFTLLSLRTDRIDEQLLKTNKLHRLLRELDLTPYLLPKTNAQNKPVETLEEKIEMVEKEGTSLPQRALNEYLDAHNINQDDLPNYNSATGKEIAGNPGLILQELEIQQRSQ